MKTIASHLSVFVTAAVLVAIMAVLASSRLEYCGQPTALPSQTNSAIAAEDPSPTLAPPLKVVFVQIEADKEGIEVGWAEN